MSDLTPIPAEQRAAYYDALLAGRAEAERLGYGPMDDRVFAAFHCALYRPMIDAARADERAKTAEGIARALLDVDPIEWALAGQSAGEDAAAIARQHANGMPSAAVEGRTGADAYPTEGAPTTDAQEAHQ